MLAVGLATGSAAWAAAALAVANVAGPSSMLLVATIATGLVGSAVAVAALAIEWRMRTSGAGLHALAESLEREVSERTVALAHANAELARANQLQGEFLASMSHELRTPMNAIIGFSRALVDGVDGELNHEQRADVERVLHSARNLLTIINDILDLSKIEAGRVELLREPLALRSLVQEAIASVRPLAVEKGLSIRNHVPDDLPPAMGDEMRTRQVLLNLLGNAIKFTAKGGVSVSASVGQGIICVSVADTGVGIPLEAQTLIFGEFQQYHETTSRTHGGTGLGLAISRRLVMLQGGEIWVRSELDQGSTFFFTLPQVPTPVAPDREVMPDASRQGLVLPVVAIVADEPALLDIMAAEASRAGLASLQATTVGAAVDLARAYRPSLFVVDLLMSDGRAISAIHAIRSASTGPLSPIVGVGAVRGKQYAVDLGPTDTVLKPADSRPTATRLRRLLGDRGASPGVLLVAEGDAEARMLWAKIAEAEGFEVREVTPGDDIVNVARGVRPVALVLDLLFPRASAWPVLARLRSSPDLADLPVALTCPRELLPSQLRAIYLGVGALFEETQPRNRQPISSLLAARAASARAVGIAAAAGR